MALILFLLFISISTCAQEPDIESALSAETSSLVMQEAQRNCSTAVQQFNQDNLPITISNPGEYCLSADMTINSANNTAITINSNNVRLDLNGKRIIGNGGINGIVINGKTNISISNGVISNMRGSGILINPTSQIITLDTITTFSNATGFALFGANQFTLKNCSAIQSLLNGFLIGNANNLNQNGILAACISYNNSNNGFSIINSSNIQLNDCTANSNRANGFTQTNGDKIFYARCIANSNTFNGFSLTGTNGILNGCEASSNTLAAFLLNGNRWQVQNCQANLNGEGFRVHGSVYALLQCIACNNLTTGFFTDSDSSFCQTRNGTALSNNAAGFQDNGTTNRFYSNFAQDNGTNYVGIPNTFLSPTVLSPINFTANIAQ